MLRYRADTTLQGLLTGAAAPTWNIFDQGGVPTNQPFPYVVVFPVTSQSGTVLSFGTDAVDTYMQISIFTQAGGFAKVRTIAARIYTLTHQQALNLSGGGFNQFFVLFDNEQEIPESDGIMQHIALRFKLMTQG
jgi:hypothetical protein